MELVKEVREPKAVNPNITLIYSSPKAGKTTIASLLPNSLILELEPNGADFISGRIQEIERPSQFEEVINLIRNSAEKVCDFLIVDTLTKLDEWSEIVGTYTYMDKLQGKKFNREGEIPNGKKILHTDRRFETVHELPNGNGYQHSRSTMTNWYDSLSTLIQLGKVKHIILLAHIKDKLIESKRGDVVEAIDINLTGKVKSIIASRVDAIGHFYRDGNKGILTFDNEYKVVCGGRCKHLNGEFVISEKLPDGTIKSYWNRIFIDKYNEGE